MTTARQATVTIIYFKNSKYKYTNPNFTMDSVPFRNKYILQSYNTGTSAHSSVGDSDPDHCLATLAPTEVQPPTHKPFTPDRQQHRFRPCGRSHDCNQNYN